MGGWSGENIINTHPDTFAVRRSGCFQAMAYTVSDRLFGFLKANERIWVNDSISDFSESITILQYQKNLPVVMVVPTLGRNGTLARGAWDGAEEELHVPSRQSHRWLTSRTTSTWSKPWLILESEMCLGFSVSLMALNIPVQTRWIKNEK